MRVLKWAGKGLLFPGIVGTQITASFLSQYLQKGSSDPSDFLPHKPFPKSVLLASISAVFWLVFLPKLLASVRPLRPVSGPKENEQEEQYLQRASEVERASLTSRPSDPINQTDSQRVSRVSRIKIVDPDEQEKFTVFGALWSALPLALLAYGANIPYIISLKLTSVGSVVTLEQTATLWAYLLSVAFLGLKHTIPLTLSSLVSCVGVLVLTIGDSRTTKDKSFFSGSILGDVLALFSSVCAGGYLVLITWKLNKYKFMSVMAYMGAIGCWSSVILPICLFVSHYTGFEKFELPQDGNSWILLAILLVVAFSFNIVVNWGVAVTSPLFVRLATACGIPVAMIVTCLMNRRVPNALQISGASIILVSFAVFVFKFQDSANTRNERKTPSQIPYTRVSSTRSV